MTNHSNRNHFHTSLFLILGVFAGAVFAEKPKVKHNPASVDRVREQVKMLDDIYKGGIVLITTHYVDGDEDLPAGTAFKKLFEAAKKKGWHEVRLLDATGRPYSDENVAKSDFEKEAIKALRSGKSFVEKVIEVESKGYFLAATPIPVVMEKCTMCHDNYKFGGKEVVGALSYKIPLSD